MSGGLWWLSRSKRENGTWPLLSSPYPWLFTISGCHEVILYNRSRESIPPDPGRRRGYLQIAITTTFGLFAFPFMTFGLCNATQRFQKFTDEVPENLDFCYAIFERLRNYGVVINPSKCIFTEDSYLKLHRFKRSWTIFSKVLSKGKHRWSRLWKQKLRLRTARWA